MLDYDITEYLLKHKEGILEEISKLATEAKNNPILQTYYRDAELEEIRQYVAKEMNLSYEDVASVLDQGLVDKCLSRM
jgi:hypothetical protein